MKQERKLLEERLKRVFDDIKSERRAVEKIKLAMNNNYNISKGDVQQLISGANSLDEIDVRLLCLLTIETYNVTKHESIEADLYFTEKEIKESKTYEEFNEELLSFPLTLNNVIQVSGEDDFITVISIKDLQKWWKSNLLEYNFDTQRNARFVRRGEEVIQTPNVNPHSVKEISEHILNGTLISTMITFNIRLGSSDSGDDLIYDPKAQKLTINKGVICDIIDGFHRVSGALQSLMVNPDIDFNFRLTITNYNLRTAQNYVGQINTVNPMDTGHLKSLKESRLSDFVVKELQKHSSLKGKVSQTSKVTTMAGHIVSFNTLADIIDEVFKIENKLEAREITEYLTDFFDYLIPSFDEFENPTKENLMSQNVFFNGYVILSKKLKDEGIAVSKIVKILRGVDFSRSNPTWSDLGILDSNGAITNKAKNKIKEYFSKLNLKEGAANA